MAKVKMFDGERDEKNYGLFRKIQKQQRGFIHQREAGKRCGNHEFLSLILNVFTNLQDNDDVISEIEVEVS